MADIPAIPSKINNYNVYNVAERLIGVGDEVTLPDFEAMADTISGAGILGEVERPHRGPLLQHGNGDPLPPGGP